MASIVQVGDRFRASIRLKGQKAQHKTFGTLEEAQKWSEYTEKQMKLPTSKQVGQYTLGSLIEGFRELRDSGDRPILKGRTQDTQLKFLDNGMGSLFLEEISVQTLVAYFQNRKKIGAGSYTCYDEFGTLERLIKTMAAYRNLEIPSSITKGKIILKDLGLISPVGGVRDRRPSPDELKRIVDYVEQPLKDIIRIAAILGFRREEITKLKWSNLNHETKMLLVCDRKHPRMKIGNNSLIPLLGNSYEILNRQAKVNEFIFTGISAEKISDSFLTACETLGIEDLHFHDLRHEAISRLFEGGMAIQQVALISGHKSWVHLKRYTNLKPQDLHGVTVTNLVSF